MVEEGGEEAPAASSDWWGGGDSRADSAGLQAPPVRTGYNPAALSPNQYAPKAPAAPTPVAGITAGIVTLLLSAVMVIVGSVGDWATISFGPVSIGAAGTNRAIAHDYGVDGWVTFGLGIVLAILAVLMVVSAEDALRSLGILLSFLSLGFAVYFFIRIVHDVLKAHPGRFAPPGSGVDVGWGVIVLLIGAVGAFAGAVSEAR